MEELDPARVGAVGTPGAVRFGADEKALLAAARAGDEAAFARLTAPYRRELHVHCYRMLGSLHDAEDLVQETMLRAWRRLDLFAGRASFRRWLYTIATNACLNTLERTPKVLLFPSGEPFEAPGIARVEHLQPYPDSLLPDSDPQARLDMRESVALAFLAAIQHLPPRQRAILLLRDVLAWSAAEVAELLETSVAAVNSGLQRARATLRQERGPVTAQPPGEQERLLLERFVEAWERVDIAGLVELLREDAVLAMPPEPMWFRGREAIGTFFATVPAEGDLSRIRLLETRANRRPGLACYLDGEPYGIMVFSVEDGGIAEIVGFADASLFPAFGLPASLPAR
jgi:RNA polymerase sigma-70 factor, ECF subfamily